MTVAIPVAFNAKGRRLTIYDIENHPSWIIEPLRCGGCNLQVGPVRRTTEAAMKADGVSAFFRRYPNKHHDENCPFDLNRRARELQIEYADVIVRSRNKWVLQIDAKDDKPTPTHSHIEEGGHRRKVEFIHSSGSTRRDRIIRAARDIAALLEDFDNMSPNDDKFRLAYAGKIIPWNEFFYRAERDVKRLYHDLLDAPGISHPRVVVGTVKTVGTSPANGKISLRVRAADASYQGPVRSEGNSLLPVVRSDAPFAVPPNVGDRILAYGLWKIWKPEAKATVAYLTLWADASGSVAKLTG